MRLRYFFALSVLLLTLPAAAIEADLVIDWSAIPRGLITNYNDVAAGTHGSFVGWYDYGAEGIPYQRMHIEARTNAMTFPVSVTLSGGSVDGDGTNWLRGDWDTDGNPEYMALSLPGGYGAPSQTNIAIAGFVKFDWSGVNYSSIDLLWMLSPNSRSGVMNSYGTGGKYLRAHGIRDDGTSSYSDQSPFFELIQVQNKTYYFTIVQRYGGTNVVLHLYDPDNNYSEAGVAHTDVGAGQAHTLVFPTAYPNGTSPGRSLYWGPMFAIYDPTDAEIAALVPGSVEQFTYEAASNLVYNANIGDTVTFPAGAFGNWTNTLVITKSNLVLNCNGAWLTNWLGSTTPLIRISASGVTVSNVFIVGGVDYTGGGIDTYSFNARIAHSGFVHLNVPVWTWAASNVTDHCWFVDNTVAVKSRGTTGTGDNLWSNFYPLPWNTLNASFVEDCNFTNVADTAFTPCFFEGQRGMYVARRNKFYLSGLNQSYQLADAHGDDLGQRGTLLSILAHNEAYLSNGAYWNAAMFDLRGGMSLIYSNTIGGTAQYVRLQEECDQYGFPQGRDWVTNSFMWGNTGIAGAFVRTDNGSTNYLTIGAAGVSSFTIGEAPADFAEAQYPHPLLSGWYSINTNSFTGGIGFIRGIGRVR